MALSVTTSALPAMATSSRRGVRHRLVNGGHPTESLLRNPRVGKGLSKVPALKRHHGPIASTVGGSQSRHGHQDSALISFPDGPCRKAAQSSHQRWRRPCQCQSLQFPHLAVQGCMPQHSFRTCERQAIAILGRLTARRSVDVQ